MKISAKIEWKLSSAVDFEKGQYSREHLWTLDGGMKLHASSSPDIVPIPLSNPKFIDPEEAFLASISSCHMLWFLSIAAKNSYTVISYQDEAEAKLAKDEYDIMCITDVTLHPVVVWSDKSPDKNEISTFHELAHKSCFIANSIKSKIQIAHEVA